MNEPMKLKVYLGNHKTSFLNLKLLSNNKIAKPMKSNDFE